MTHFPETAVIYTLLQEYIDKYKKGVGIVVGLISPAGTEIIPYGYLDTNRILPVQQDTLFEIGSVSKIFTALLLAEMVSRQEVQLDDPISKFLPQTVQTPRFEGQEITLLHLATHTAGLPRSDSSHTPSQRDNPYHDYKVEQLYDFLMAYELPQLPGTVATYSNLSFGLLGHILSLKSGLPYDQMINQSIGQPLNMPDTASTLSLEQNGRFAQAHNVVCEAVPHWTMPTLAGAGALRATIADMLQFIGGNLGSLSSTITPTMQQMAHTAHATGEPDHKTRLLGWGVEKKYAPNMIVADGGTGGSRAFIGFIPEKKMGVVILSNAANDIYHLGRHLLDARYSLPEWKPPRQEIALSARQLDAYVGQYAEASTDDIYEVTREENSLFVQILGEGRHEVFAESPIRFFYKIADAQHFFLRDEKGSVIYMVTCQFGQESLAKRIQ